jgi:hypothetical protein
VLYVNKLRLARLIPSRIDEHIESTCAVGVDEMSWVRCEGCCRAVVVLACVVKCAELIVIWLLCMPCFPGQDDLTPSHYKWPTPAEARAYRNKVRAVVDSLIQTMELKLPINWNSPWSAIARIACYDGDEPIMTMGAHVVAVCFDAGG